jgi:chondroitin AC lyase
MYAKYFFVLLCSFIVFNNVSVAQNNDIQTIKKNLMNDALISQGYKPRIERYIISDYSKAEAYLKKMNVEGSWSDIDYADRDNKWAPLAHLDRILVMAFNYMKDTSVLYEDLELLQGLEKAIDFWYKKNPTCDNWYKNKIAKQFYFNVIALLLEGKVDKSLHSKMVNDLTDNPTMTGSNRTLLATSTFYRGVLENDVDMVKLGVRGVTDQIEITVKEGIQPDFSFHQHGHFIYNGSYGFNFVRASIWLATIVHETSFAYSDEQIKVLRDYYLNGTRWMMRGELVDYNVRGRQIGRADAMKLNGDLFEPILEQFIIADPQFAREYKISKKQIKNQLPQIIYGNKHYWRSDYTVHHRPKYFTSLKMCSNRTIGIELNMNTENKLGYWLPYGLTYIYRRGDEYHGIFPAWNWARLPGVTSPYVEVEEFKKGKAHTQNTSFVGGVSSGKYGVSAMDFSKDNTSAKKAWFWFDDEWIALGAGIDSENTHPIVTGINQTILNGEILIDGKKFSKGNQTLNDPLWILHDSVGYIFPGTENVEIKTEVQSGNMQRIYGLGKDTIYSQDVFSVWFNHGQRPKNKNYEYIVVPGVNSNDLIKYSKNLPVNILSNTPDIQAVSHKELQIIGIVFRTAKKLQIKEIEIEVDQPCLVLIDMKNDEISITDPTTEKKEINVSIKNNGNVQNKLVKLPDHEFAGKSIVMKFDFNQ